VSKLPVIPYRRLRKIAEFVGFTWINCEGSHNTFRNAEGKTVVLPNHGQHVIVRPLLRKILRDIGLTIEDYQHLLRKF
jgi:predicted RNA binding protein YcfA (HicA-like mRNA interferase family)